MVGNMEVDVIREKVRRFIVGSFLFGEEPDWLKDDSSLLETGVIDSTGVLELIGFVEREFGVVVGDNEVRPENLDSIRNLGKYLAGKRDA